MRKLTEDQKAKSEEKRNQFKKIIKTVAGMSKEQREELSKKIMVTNCDGHTLSIYNNCLIGMQGGMTATIVGGFHQWLKHGRAVQKGQHGYAILFPREKKNNNGNGDNEEITEEKAQIHFLTGYVFDISQTIEIETN